MAAMFLLGIQKGNGVGWRQEYQVLLSLKGHFQDQNFVVCLYVSSLVVWGYLRLMHVYIGDGFNLVTQAWKWASLCT